MFIPRICCLYNIDLFGYNSLNMLTLPALLIKPLPNDRNMSTQQIATLLGETCCVRLATVLRHLGCLLEFENGQI